MREDAGGVPASARRRYSLQRKISALFILFGLVLAVGLTTQGRLSQQMIVHPIWEDLLRAGTAQYLAGGPASRALPSTGRIRGWRLGGAGAPARLPPGMPAYMATLGPGYHDEQAMDRLEQERSHAVLVTPLGEGERIVMAIDITDLENHQNKAALIGMLVALVSALMIVGSLLWLYRSMRRPMQSLARQMDGLDPAQPTQRLATGFALSELHDIAVLVNRHLDRVERFIERERSLLDQASHEFRTPVAVIAGAVDVMRLHALPPAATALLNRIQASTDNLTQIMSALLFLSREPDGKAALETIRLDALVAVLVDDHQHLLQGKRAHFEIDELQPLWIDSPEAIARIVVGNLLRNAAENSFDGPIRVRLADRCLSIQDSGEGFDVAAAARRHALAMHDSTKQGGGKGLGLFLIRRVCERFGWTLAISSHPGHGTLAEIRFPEGR